MDDVSVPIIKSVFLTVHAQHVDTLSAGHVSRMANWISAGSTLLLKHLHTHNSRALACCVPCMHICN
ncbi:hypothetical protein C0Q70_19280 [Pomacea canaliculata]|uniref:Uncharacterized protein n=1 Tax=Pomacea canaliculata TaxID=400727 RepID=A0A2T7NIX3_POMCA|nr:hypothetical protein C0Q70_19280 [Pomacea canaliculata]